MSNRSLKCTRIRIHVQLFISFALNNIMWVIWYKEVVPKTYVVLDNAVSELSFCETFRNFFY